MLLCAASAANAAAMTLDAAIAGSHRDPANVARDPYRHPKETLEFFGLEPDMTVVEIWPGGGWWTEILAPVLRADGEYVAAGFVTDAPNAPQYFATVQKALADKLAAKPTLYDRAQLTSIGVPDHTEPVPNGTADLVLTFRNVHNWFAADTAEAMFRAFNKMLRPGGVLGVEDHRAPPGTGLDVM
jgi:predicted methyltransferase